MSVTKALAHNSKYKVTMVSSNDTIYNILIGIESCKETISLRDSYHIISTSLNKASACKKFEYAKTRI